jgi:hypothetical protein
MTSLAKILPGTGRGTIRRMVEGSEPRLLASDLWRGSDPSVTPSARHLPVPGRI